VKVITWNVNSVKQRLPRLLALLERQSPDVVCLQETKSTDEEFPFAELEAAGYAAEAFGQKAYNGVAILSREPLTDLARGFGGDPIPGESRIISALIGDVRVIGAYVVNGKEVGNPSYDVKLAWLEALHAWIADAFDPLQPLILTGDFNICADDRDVYDPVAWKGRNLCSEPERARLGALLDWGLTDLGRQAAGDVQGPWTFWDYRSGAFHRGWGLRIDLALGTAPVAQRLLDVEVDREERKPQAKASPAITPR
jgi:exodeoxyribonuclease-3